MQTVLVSATLDQRVRELSTRSLSNPVVVSDGGDKEQKGSKRNAREMEEEGGGEEEEEGRGAAGQRVFSLPSKLRQHFMVSKLQPWRA
eukprot:2474618-Rhodomonas_salina.2